MEGTFLLSIILMIYFFLIIIIFRWNSLNRKKFRWGNITYEMGKLNMPCVISGENYNEQYPENFRFGTCESNLVCDDLFVLGGGVCKAKIGEPCSTLLDCNSEATICLNNVCESNINELINQPCLTNRDCGNDYNCENNLCKIKSGNTNVNCGNNSDCSSDGYCSNGLCKYYKIEGIEVGDGKCLPSLKAINGYCSNGRTCRFDGKLPCSSGSNCHINDEIFLNTFNTVFSDEVYNIGRCGTGSRTLFQTCNDTDKVCAPPYICVDNVCVEPFDSERAYGGACLDGMTNVGGVCKFSADKPVSQNDNTSCITTCVNERCSSETASYASTFSYWTEGVWTKISMVSKVNIPIALIANKSKTNTKIIEINNGTQYYVVLFDYNKIIRFQVGTDSEISYNIPTFSFYINSSFLDINFLYNNDILITKNYVNNSINYLLGFISSSSSINDSYYGSILVYSTERIISLSCLLTSSNTFFITNTKKDTSITIASNNFTPTIALTSFNNTYAKVALRFLRNGHNVSTNIDIHHTYAYFTVIEGENFQNVKDISIIELDIDITTNLMYLTFRVILAEKTFIKEIYYYVSNLTNIDNTGNLTFKDTNLSSAVNSPDDITLKYVSLSGDFDNATFELIKGYTTTTNNIESIYVNAWHYRKPVSNIISLNGYPMDRIDNIYTAPYGRNKWDKEKFYIEGEFNNKTSIIEFKKLDIHSHRVVQAVSPIAIGMKDFNLYTISPICSSI